MNKHNRATLLAASVAAALLIPGFGLKAAAPSSPQGFITAKEFLDINGTAVADLTGNAKFPNSPDVVDYPARLEWPTGPDDATPPPGNVKNNYGVQVIGYFYPPAAGQYRFAISADDNAVLYLSTDSNPANKVQLAVEAGWNSVRNWDGQETDRSRALVDVGTADERWNNQSKPITLAANVPYYIEALMKEGGGGDNVAVAYRTDGTWPTVLGGDLPIPGSQLSTIDKTNGPISIMTHPLSQAVGENQPVSFKVEANGTPPYTYQWTRNGTDILDETNQVYTLAAAPLSENGAQFRCRVSNAGGSITSNPATLTVTSDTVPPTITKVTGSATFNRATIVFSEPVTAASAGTLANYQVTGTPALAITAVTVINPTTVTLTTGTQTEGASYTLAVSNIKDISVPGNTIAPNTQMTLRAFVFSRGYATWERWQDQNGDTTIANFEANVLDPAFRPSDVAGVSSFFGSPRDVANNYGVKAYGFFVPPVTGSYVFFLQSDDQGDLFLSTDASPANKKLLARQPGWGPINQWLDPDLDRASGGAENSSDQFSLSEWTPPNTITLNQGTRYYMEMLVSEGGGGDGGEVYYKLAADPDPVNGAAPNTRGVVIGTYADPTGSSVTISQQPQSLTLNQGRKARFTVTATGSSTIIYQWQKAPPGSGTFADILGASGASYTTANLVLGDSGAKYRCVLSVLGGATATSSEATLTVVPDTFPPALTGVGSLLKGTAVEIGIGFDEPVNAADAAAVANYGLSVGTITGVRFENIITSGVGAGSDQLGSAQSAAVLTTSGLTAGAANVVVTVRNVRDLIGNAIPASGISRTITATSKMQWTAVGGDELRVGSVANPAVPGTWTDDAVAYSDKDFDLVSSGSAHWVNYDEQTFVYESITGDFDKRVRVEYQDAGSQWARAGLQLREVLNEGTTRDQAFQDPDNLTGTKFSQAFTIRVNPVEGWFDTSTGTANPGNNSYEVIHRPREGYNYDGFNVIYNILSGFGGAPPYPNAWMRLKREGQKITCWRSDDGITWAGGANVTYTDDPATPENELLAATLFVGPFFGPELLNNGAAAGLGKSVHVKFREYSDVPGAGPVITSVSIAGGTVTVVWTGGGTLYSTTSLNPGTTWNSTTDVDGTYTATVGAGNLFFRVQQ